MAFKTITIPFGEWRPDAADLNSGFMSDVKNALQYANGYRRFESRSVLSGSPALASRCYGAAFADQGATDLVTFAGSATLLNRRTSGAFADVSRTVGGNYAAAQTARWSFAQAGTALIAVNTNDDPQVYSDVSAASNFAALGGSPPRAMGVSQVGDFTFLWALASNKRKLQWSAINDITGWTVGTNLSDEQTFPDLGNITGVYGDQSGFVLQQYGVRTFQFLPGDTSTIFRFDKVRGAMGCISPWGWAAAPDGNIYYVSYRGFHSIGPGGIKNLALNKLSDWFRTNASRGVLPFAECVAHATLPRVAWMFNSVTAEDYDTMVVYDYSLDRFIYAQHSTTVSSEAVVKHAYGSAAPATSNFDTFHGFSVITHILGQFGTVTGTDASLTTSEIELFPGRLAHVSAVRPIITIGELDNIDVSDAYRNTLEESATTATTTTADTDGKFSMGTGGITARFHKFTLTMAGSGAAAANRFLGIQVIASEAGEA